MQACMNLCAPHAWRSWERGQKRAMGYLGLELQVVLDPWFSVRATSASPWFCIFNLLSLIGTDLKRWIIEKKIVCLLAQRPAFLNVYPKHLSSIPRRLPLLWEVPLPVPVMLSVISSPMWHKSKYRAQGGTHSSLITTKAVIHHQMGWTMCQAQCLGLKPNRQSLFYIVRASFFPFLVYKFNSKFTPLYHL